MQYSYEFVTHVWVREMFKSCETLPCLPYPPPSVFVHTLAQMPVWCNIYMSPCHICESSWHTWVTWDTALPPFSPLFYFCTHTCANAFMMRYLHEFMPHIFKFVACLNRIRHCLASLIHPPRRAPLFVHPLLFLCTHLLKCLYDAICIWVRAPYVWVRDMSEHLRQWPV